MKQLIITDEAVEGKCQHKKACSDCPWAKTAMPGWLGALSAEEWIEVAHADNEVPCHAIKNTQCAGLAIYRANMSKLPRNPDVLVLPPDRENVFSYFEFLEHHRS